MIIFILCVYCSNNWAQENQKPYSLKKLTEIALSQSDLIKSKQEEISEKKWMVSQSQRWQNPEFSIKAGNNKQGTESGINYELTLSQPFYFPGKRTILESILTGEQRKAEITLEETKFWVFYEVVYLSYSYILAKEYSKHLQEQKNRLETIERFLSNRPIASPQKIMEKNRVRQKIMLIEKEHLNNLTRQKVIWEKLNLYLHLSAPVDIRLGWFKNKIELDINSLLSKIINNNFELKKQKEEITQVELAKALAQKDKYSDFTLSAFFSETRGGIAERFFGGGISFFLPFWDQSTDKIKSFESKIQSESYKKNYMVHNLSNNLKISLLDYQSKSQIIKDFPISFLKNVHNQMNYADAEFRKGRIELLSYLDAEETSSQIHSEIFNSQMEYVKSYIDILILTGDKEFQEGDLYDL